MGLCIGRVAAGSGRDFVAIEEALLRLLGGGAAVTQQIVISFDLRTTLRVTSSLVFGTAVLSSPAVASAGSLALIKR
jgi:hypothetical protein